MELLHELCGWEKKIMNGPFRDPFVTLLLLWQGSRLGDHSDLFPELSMLKLMAPVHRPLNRAVAIPPLAKIMISHARQIL